MELKIKIKAYEASLVDSASVKIVAVAKAANANVSGPVPLPTRREVFTVLRSVHLHKKSREQFEMRTHKRLIVIKDADAKLLDNLKRLELASGVQISVETK
ncbi:30S ribosomal protein S10 [Candidatus Mycoplasma mahonii]|uniref:30S ribosomal protein S10 n=1 Tax=Candidatus Mycoplasma mahonii TaxID=3004105 RepID=UPI0026ECA1C4|nr:30S ribosomal protein S10 [Candidatus Mycoplasma mahonii]WKX02253.1 30S ribosomal protein S10 [Candidatus Mycoplasma mahonii]